MIKIRTMVTIVAAVLLLWMAASLFDLDEVSRPGASGYLASWNMIPLVFEKSDVKEVVSPKKLEASTETVLNEISTSVQYEFIECLEVDLPRELQQKIYEFAYANDISPFLIFAIAERESNYKSDLIGDNGRAVGMMQIHIRYCESIMKELGIPDYGASEPYNNACIAVKILKNYFEKNDDVYWVLMAYNGGESYANAREGNPSEYAKEVVERADELEKAQLSNRLN